MVKGALADPKKSPIREPMEVSEVPPQSGSCFSEPERNMRDHAPSRVQGNEGHNQHFQELETLLAARPMTESMTSVSDMPRSATMLHESFPMSMPRTVGWPVRSSLMETGALTDPKNSTFREPMEVSDVPPQSDLKLTSARTLHAYHGAHITLDKPLTCDQTGPRKQRGSGQLVIMK